MIVWKVMICLYNFFPIFIFSTGKSLSGLYLRNRKVLEVSKCDLDLTFDLATVTLSLKILSGLYLGNRKV